MNDTERIEKLLRSFQQSNKIITQVLEETDKRLKAVEQQISELRQRVEEYK